MITDFPVLGQNNENNAEALEPERIIFPNLNDSLEQWGLPSQKPSTMPHFSMFCSNRQHWKAGKRLKRWYTWTQQPTHQYPCAAEQVFSSQIHSRTSWVRDCIHFPCRQMMNASLLIQWAIKPTGIKKHKHSVFNSCCVEVFYNLYKSK